MTSEYNPIPLPDFCELPVEKMRANAHAFYEEMKTRHTVRDFDARPVPRDIIEICLRTAGTAPNGANHQPWHFAVVGDPAMKANPPRGRRRKGVLRRQGWRRMARRAWTFRHRRQQAVPRRRALAHLRVRRTAQQVDRRRHPKNYYVQNL